VTRVAVLERGRLIAVGPHADLLETCPAYRRLYQAREHKSADEIGTVHGRAA
jgi:ABC-type multidrug transport system fused ATPase/permease subunit